MQPPDDIWNLPEILIYPGRPQVEHNGTTVHSDAIEISTNPADSQRLKCLIQHSADLEDPDIKLVLRDLRFEMPDIYANIFGAQNIYLESHRNISIAGLCKEAMDVENVVQITGNHYKTMCDAIQAVPGIEQVYATKRITDHGNWNLSTTVDQWENAKTWIDQNLLPMYHSIDDNVKLGYPKFKDFPAPARMFFKGWSDTTPSISGTTNRSTVESYAKTLQASILGPTHNPTTPTPKPPAWQQISKPTVIYTQNSAPNRKDDASAVSTSTTASLTNDNSTELLAAIQQQWKKEKLTMEADMKEKLSSITENLDQAIKRISVDMTALVQEHMASMKQDLLQAAEARENKLISKLLTAMTSDDSPYATHAQLQTVMTSIEAIVQKVSPSPNLPPSPLRLRKRNKQAESNDDMETEIFTGDEKPPDDIPNRQ
jgi:hypothetical protein